MWFYILLTLLILSAVFSLDNVTLDLLTPISEYGEACGYESCPKVQPNMLNVHIVPATHAELGGPRSFYQFYEGDDLFPFEAEHGITVKNIFDSVITSLWSERTRTFTLSDLPYFFHWWKNRDGTVRRMVYELIRQGRLYFVGGGWGMSDEASSNYHAIIDHYTYGLRKLNATFLDCGRPLVTWQADAFGHSREFASLMAQMGFDGHFINPISFDDELSRMRSKSLEFVWRGSDDLGPESDIFTHKLFDGYWSPPGFCFGYDCTDPLIVTSDSQLSNVVERIKEFGRLMQVRQGPYYTTNNVMVIMGERMGYYDSHIWFANIDKLIMKVNEAKPRTGLRLRLMYSTPACYLKEVQKSQPTLRTKQDDFFPMAYDKDTYFTAMYFSRSVIKYHTREIHLYMVIAKQLQMFGHLKNNDQIFEDIQWIAGAMLDHTILSGSIRQSVSWYYTNKVHKAKLLAMKIIRSAFNRLRIASANTTYHICQFNVTSCPTISGQRSFIVIYNPLAWPVSLPVRLPVQRVKYNLYNHKGEKVNHSIMSIPDIVKRIPERTQLNHVPALDNELVFIAEDLPPMGFRSYFLEIEKSRTKRAIIKTMAKNRRIISRMGNATEYDDDYEEFIDFKQKPRPIIEFANISTYTESPKEYVDVVTPRYKDDLLEKAESPHREFESDEEDTPRPDMQFLLPSRRMKLKRTTPIPNTPHRSTFTTEEPYNPQTAPPRTIQPSTETPKPPLTTTTSTTTEPIIQTTSPMYSDDEPEHTGSSDDEDEGEVSWAQEIAFRKLERAGYHSILSGDDFIKNEHIKINLNQKSGKIKSIALSNGVFMNLDIDMMYYVSDDPFKMKVKRKTPGAYVFRTMDLSPLRTGPNQQLKVLKSAFVQEAQIQFSSFSAATVRLYKNLPYVEVNWIVGPISIQDGLGKEMFIRYSTDLINSGVLYTDSNGRQTIKRIKNMRPTYTPANLDPVAGNFYPVTSKVYIEDTDKNIRFSVFPDRSQGCTSLNEGQLDLMLHRRILTDDSRVNGAVNETILEGKGLIVRGNHRLYVSKADYRPNKIYEKKLAKELHLQPLVFTSNHPLFDKINTHSVWSSCRNEYTAIKKKLPIGIHVLSFEKWSDELLIRLENYLEKSDVVKAGVKKVNILGLFKDYVITFCRETMLGTNIWKSDYVKMQWQRDRFVKNFNDVYGNSSNLVFAEDEMTGYESVDLINGIELAPQQIRTFVCSYEKPSILGA